MTRIFVWTILIVNWVCLWLTPLAVLYCLLNNGLGFPEWQAP